MKDTSGKVKWIPIPEQKARYNDKENVLLAITQNSYGGIVQIDMRRNVGAEIVEI